MPERPLPVGWARRRLLDNVTLPAGQVDPRRLPYADWPLVAPDHIESGTGRLLSVQTALEQNAISGKYPFEAGDVLYSKIRPHLRKAVLATERGLCSADMYPLRCKAEVVPWFLLAVLLGGEFSRFAEAVSMRSGFPKINRQELAEFRAAFPPVPEQRRIAEILDTLDAAIRQTEEVIAKLQMMKQGLLHDLLTRGIDENGELRDPVRHPEQFKESALGKIPKAWEFVSLGSCLHGSAQNGLYKPAEDYGDDGVPIVRIDAFYDGVLAPISQLRRVRLTPAERRVYALEEGDILVNRVNSIDFVGKSALVRLLPEPTVFESNMMRLKVEASRVRPAFAIRWACSPWSQRHFHSRAKNAIAQASVNQTDVRDLRMPLPSLREQDAIAARLDSVDERATREGGQLDKLRLLKHGLMHDLLTGRVRVRVEGEDAA